MSSTETPIDMLEPIEDREGVRIENLAALQV